MKHNSSNRRSRSRGNKQRHSGGRNNYESNGPGGKVRGTVQQVLDKYLALARDAQSSGDRIGAESFFQFAEHYFRVLNVEGSNGQARRDRPSSAPGDLSVPIVEGNTLGADAANIQSNATEISDLGEASDTEEASHTGDAPSIDPAEQMEPELAPEIADTGSQATDEGSGLETEESSEPKVIRRRRAESESSPEEVKISNAS